MIVLVAVAAIFGQFGGDTSLRCGGRLVTPGLTRYRLEQRCGPPGYRVVIPVLRESVDPLLGPNFPALAYEDVEIWTYAPRRGALLRQVEIRRGIVAGIKELERLGPADRRACNRGAYPTRAPVGVIALSCGAPADKTQWREAVPTAYGDRIRSFERWVYDLGPGRFLRILTFENGRLKDVTEADRTP